VEEYEDLFYQGRSLFFRQAMPGGKNRVPRAQHSGSHYFTDSDGHDAVKAPGYDERGGDHDGEVKGGIEEGFFGKPLQTCGGAANGERRRIAFDHLRIDDGSVGDTRTQGSPNTDSQKVGRTKGQRNEWKEQLFAPPPGPVYGFAGVDGANENEMVDSTRVGDRHALSDASSHRVADEGCPPDAKGIHQPHDTVRVTFVAEGDLRVAVAESEAG